MKNFLSVKEAAKALGVSTNTVYKYLEGGQIRGRRVGKGRFKIPRSEVKPYVAEEAPLITVAKISPGNIFKALRGASYEKADYIFFELFLALVFIGNGLLTLLYRLSLFTPYSQALPQGADDSLIPIIFFLIPLLSMLPGILILLEVFLKIFKGKHVIIHLLAMFVSGYSAYFAFAFGGHEVFALFLAILIVLVLQAIRSRKKSLEMFSFERQFLNVLLIGSVIYILINTFVPGTFPIYPIRAAVENLGGLFILLLWLILVVFPLSLLFIPRFKYTNADLLVLPFLAMVTTVVAIFISVEGKWIASYHLYLVVVFEIFLLWWRRRKKEISANFSYFVVFSLLWAAFVVFLGVFGMGFVQRSIIDNRVLEAKESLARASKDITTHFDNIDRRLTSTIQKAEVSSVIASADEEKAIAKAKEVYDGVVNLRRVLILAADGRVLGAYPRDFVIQGENFSDREYFRIIKQTYKPYTSAIFRGALSDYVVVRAHPIIRNNLLVGAVAVAPELGEMSRELQETTREELVYGYDIENNYTIHSDDTKLGSRVDEHILDSAQEGVYRDIFIFRVFQKIASPNWTLYIEGKLSSVLRNLLGINVLVGVLILTGSSLGFGMLSVIAKKWETR